MGCALKTFFILLLFSYVPLSLSDEVLDKIKTMEGRVLKLEEQNLSKEHRILNLETTLATAIQAFDQRYTYRVLQTIQMKLILL